MSETYWTVESYVPLTPALRTSLASRFGWADVPGHTHAAIVAIRIASVVRGNEHIVTFVYSFVESAWAGNATGLEAAIASECRTRLTSARNAEGPASIAGRRQGL